MASSNTTRDEVLALFPDNLNQEISASDMRIYVNAVFDDREVKVVKIEKVIHLPPRNSNIYEHTIVLVYNDTIDNNGVYLSKVNQPIAKVQLTKIAGVADGTIDGVLLSDGTIPMDDGYIPDVDQDIATKIFVTDAVAAAASGNPYPIGTAEYFLYAFNTVNVTSEADYFYDVDDNIESINVLDDDGITVLYVVELGYTAGDIDLKTITDNLGNKVDISFIYTTGLITNKDTVYTAI